MDLFHLTRLTHLGFKIHHFAFLYMPESPIKWNLHLRRLEYTSSKTPWYIFGMSMLLNLLVSAGSLYDITTHLFIKPKLEYDISILVLHMCAVLVCSAVPFGAALLSRHPKFLKGYNQVVNFHQSLPITGIVPEIHQPPKNEFVFYVIYTGIGLILLGAVTPFAILFCSLYFHFDPYYFVVQDIFGRIEHQSMAIKCTCFMFRFIIVLAGFEASRVGVFAIYCFANIILQLFIFISSISRLRMTTNSKRAYRIFWMYKKFLVCFREIQDLLAQFNSLLISLSYWGIVLLTCAVVKLKTFLVVEMFALLLGLDLCVFLLLSFGVAIISKLDACVKEAIARWGNEIKMNSCRRVTDTVSDKKEMLTLERVFESLQPVRMEYKPFFVMDQEFRRDMSKNLVLRIFDGILILKV